jgi:hypothetical protein
MDRSTKATLWIVGGVLFVYYVWLYVDCKMDDACHVVYCGPRGGPCGISWHGSPGNPK